MSDLKKKYRGKIYTYSGTEFDVARPNIEDINFIDIAHALSCMPRWGGHLPHFFSVAQHSMIVAEILTDYYDRPDLALSGLMHDASEAYMMDIPSTLKPLIPHYKPLEKALQELIFQKFEIAWPMDRLIKKADEIALDLEWQQLMLNKQDYIDLKPYSIKVQSINHAHSRMEFMFTQKFITLVGNAKLAEMQSIVE